VTPGTPRGFDWSIVVFGRQPYPTCVVLRLIAAIAGETASFAGCRLPDVAARIHRMRPITT
jgi:hypothetical protein